MNTTVDSAHYTHDKIVCRETDDTVFLSKVLYSGEDANMNKQKHLESSGKNYAPLRNFTS